MGVVTNPELPLLLLMIGVVAAVVAWLLATFTQFVRGYRYRVTLGLIAFPLGGLMGMVSTMNAATLFGDLLAGKTVLYLIAIGCGGYLLFGFLACWTVVRLAGRWDRKHTLSLLYNLVREHKNRDSN